MSEKIKQILNQPTENNPEKIGMAARALADDLAGEQGLRNPMILLALMKQFLDLKRN